MQICGCVSSVFQRTCTNISLKKEKEKKKSLVSSIHLRFLFLKRLKNLLMYKKTRYLFSFTDTSWRDPALLPVWSPGWQIWLLSASRSGQHFLRDMGCWDGWVRSRLNTVQSSSVPRASWGCISAGNSLWISPLTVSLHTCSSALGCISGALLARQTPGAHESSQCELSSLDHIMETVPPHCKRISPSHHSSEEPSECGNCLLCCESRQFLPCASPSSLRWHHCVRYF